MRMKSGVVSGASRLARIQELSREATRRLKWFDYYNSHGRNARLTCRYFGISPQTFYRWKRRYDSRCLESLEDRSHKPKRLRQPTWSSELAQEVLRLREEYPRWGKDKLSELLRRQGCRVSASMVGRILRRMKERGVLKEPIPNHVSARKRPRQRPFATRKPKDYPVQETGDIVQLDTLDLRPLPGVLFKHFTAHDVFSKWNVMSVHRQANASTAAHFLDILKERMPFPVKAIQVDGGPEFEAIFEK
jgi:putative transposase